MYEDPVEAINKITRECMLIAAGVDGEIGKDTLDLFKVFTDTED